MERRLLIAFALSFLVIVLSRSLWEPPKSPVPGSRTQSAEKKRVEPEESSSPKAETATTGAVSTLLETKNAKSEQLFEVDTDLFKLLISNKGAVVKSWILKKYKDSNGKPLDLVNEKRAQIFGYPLSLKIDKDEDRSKALATSLFISQSPSRLSITSSATSSGEIVFEFSDQNIGVQKRLIFSRESYAVDVDCKVWLNGKPSNYYLVWKSWIGDPTVDERTAIRRALYRSGQKITRLEAKKVQAEQELSGSYDFVGLEDQYFAAVFLPFSTDPIKRIEISRDENNLDNGKKESLLNAGVLGNSQEHEKFKVFVGPKDTEVLQKAGNHLVELIDYGWFAVVVEPLFFGLKGIYSFTHNYGLAIIILTILINLALFPLRYKSIMSAQKMQKLQPQMKAIQEKYKKLKPTDPKRQQMNTEVMALYKEHGVNPLGGCLPLVLQMPFFIAFYNLLSVSIELRHAPFVLWIRDLSAADPTFVLPILMTISMIVMQKMTPSPTTDPIQAKMMLAMPLVFGFMLAFTSSGLVLYWLTSNLVGIIQQHLMNKYVPSQANNFPKRVRKK